MTERHGPYITTVVGKKLNLLDPSPDDIELVDIAHGLSNTCRYSGQVHHHYSVAAHSLALASYMKYPDLKLMALLHDASEAYITDIPRPVKVLCPDYVKVEKRIEQAVAMKFDFDKKYIGSAEKEFVHTVDTLMPAYEQLVFKGRSGAPDWALDLVDETRDEHGALYSHVKEWTKRSIVEVRSQYMTAVNDLLELLG